MILLFILLGSITHMQYPLYNLIVHIEGYIELSAQMTRSYAVQTCVINDPMFKLLQAS